MNDNNTAANDISTSDAGDTSDSSSPHRLIVGGNALKLDELGPVVINTGNFVFLFTIYPLCMCRFICIQYIS
jgi:hypothetical protein